MIRKSKKTAEALAILKALELPKAQQNKRSALTLLAFVDIKPGTPWAEASAPLMGITPIMTFAAEHFGEAYAPNTRETFRRETVHQFLQAGLIVANPDNPNRPVNSPKAVYQIEAKALDLLRTFGTKMWGQYVGLRIDHKFRSSCLVHRLRMPPAILRRTWLISRTHAPGFAILERRCA